MGIAVGTAMYQRYNMMFASREWYSSLGLPFLNVISTEFAVLCPKPVDQPLDLDQLGGQVVKSSTLESRSRRFESRPSGLYFFFSQVIGQSTEHSVLITLRKGKPKIE